MPLGSDQPQCSLCASQESLMWRKNEKGQVVCNKCPLNSVDNTDPKGQEGCSSSLGENQQLTGLSTSNPTSTTPATGPATGTVTGTGTGSNKCGTSGGLVSLRKSSRNRGRGRGGLLASKQTVGKGRGRRAVWKRCVYRSPNCFVSPMTSEWLFFRGSYFQVGDIVSMTDLEGDTYYAQIRGFLQDQFCEKSATITWLLPTSGTPKDRFDPSTYILGPEEELPRKLDSMRFVSHAPSDYYKAQKSPYPVTSVSMESGFIWTRLGCPQIVKKSAGLQL